jgi:hypothetical protein
MKKVILKGGLGNQLFQLAEALNIVNENVTLDWCIARPILEESGIPALAEYSLPLNFNFTRKRRVKDRIFRPTFFAREVVNEVFNGKSMKSLSFSSRIRMFTYFHQTCLLLPNKIKLNCSDKLLIGYFQDQPRIKQSEQYKLSDLKLSNYSRNLDEYKAESSVQTPLIVHMRIGDYEKSSEFGVLTSDYYESAINHIASKVSNFESVPIWLFSDSPEKALYRFPKKYKSQMRVIPNTFESAAETLEVMRLGKYYVIANSTYSWWAAYLSHHSDKIVVAPDPWFNELEFSKTMIPSDWFKIPSDFLNFNSTS